MDDKLAELRAHPEKFAEMAAPHVKRARGLDAPTAALEALRSTLDVPFEQALEGERKKFMDLRGGEQSKAQRHMFFAERDAAKVAGVGKDVKPREIRQVAVIGAGTMGGGISMSFANAGIPVTVVEAAEDALKRGFGVMEKNYKTSASRGALARGGRDEADGPADRHHRYRRDQGRRPGHRGGVRGNADQEGSVRQAR